MWVIRMIYAVTSIGASKVTLGALSIQFRDGNYGRFEGFLNFGNLITSMDLRLAISAP